MHDFINTGQITMNIISLGIIPMSLIIAIYIIDHFGKSAAALTIIITLGIDCGVIALGASPIYEGKFKVDKVNYTNKISQNNTITIKNKDGNTQTLDDHSSQSLKPGDTVYIGVSDNLLSFNKHQTPTINKDLRDYHVEYTSKNKPETNATLQETMIAIGGITLGCAITIGLLILMVKASKNNIYMQSMMSTASVFITLIALTFIGWLVVAHLINGH